jgi:hypothetical protein
MHLPLAPGACLAALFFLAMCQSLPAADLDPVVVGQWPRYTGGSALRVALSGKYAYVVAAGSTVSGDLQVLDISNPNLPQRVGVYDGVNASSDVVVCGHYAYVSGRWSEGVLRKSGLRVLDVSDPSKPRVVGRYTNTKGAGWAESVSVSGDYAYVTGVDSLEVIDISTPTEPKRVGLCPIAGGYAATQLAVCGQYAYLASGEGGLQIIDISNPANPQLLGSWSGGGNANWVAVSGNHAFVAEYALSDGTNGVRGGGLQILSVSDPANPRWVGACNRGEMAWCVAVSGDRAYVAASYDGLKVIDISDPANPHQIGSCDTQEARGIAISGHYAYVAAGSLQVIDVSDPAAPKRVGDCRTGQFAGGVAASGNRAYVVEHLSWTGSNCLVLDVSDPANPRHLRTYDTSAWESGLPVSMNFTYVSDPDEVWLVNDVTDPANPQRVGGYKTIASAFDVLVAGHHAYVPSYSQVGSNLVYGFQVIDISNPAQPRRVGHYYGANSIGWGWSVALYGHYVCLTDSEETDLGRLLIVDVSDPTTPRQVGTYNLTGGATDVVVSGQFAYVAASEAGLQVLDLSILTQPRFIASVGVGAHKVSVSGCYAFVTDRWKGGGSLHIIDISDPAHPVYAGRYPIAGEDLAISGNYAYVANGGYGLKVLDISRPAIPQRLGGYALNGEISGLAASGDYAYVSGGEHSGGLRVLDVSTPASVRQVGAADNFGFANGLAVSGSYVYDAGLGVCDVSTPISPQLVGFCGVGDGRAVAVREHLAYTVAGGSSDSTSSLQVLEVSDPHRPRQIGEYSLGFDLDRSDSFVILGGEYAYVTGTFPGLEPVGCLQVIDISDPANPRGIGRFDYHGDWHGLALSGQYACLAAGNAGLLFVDLADPAYPRLVGSYTEHGAEGVAVFGNYAYVAVSPRGYWPLAPRNPGEYSGFGVEVIDISEPARPRRVGGNSTAGDVLNRSNMVAAGGRIYFTGGQELAILDLYQPPRLDSLRLDAQGFHLLLRGVTGQMLRLERSRDLRTWDPFATVPIPANGQTLIDPAAAAEPMLFYRAVSVP